MTRDLHPVPSQSSARRWVREFLMSQIRKLDSRKQRRIRFEPLENRQLMAGDTYQAAAGMLNDPSNVPAIVSSSPMSTSGLVAEGENANDLVAFAKALKQAGVRFFGADWCPFCNQQKGLFKEGAQYLPFVEVTNADRSLNATGTSENITTYPTWEFANAQRVTGVQTLAQLSQLSGIAIPQSSQPNFPEISSQTVLNGSPLAIPIDAYDPNGGPLTVSVTSSNPSAVTAEMITNPKSLKLSIENYGDMVFRLYADEVPDVVNRMSQLVNSGFYNKTGTNKIIFHRVISGFVIQSGDPTGTGSGGSSLGNFDDQFNVNLQHNRTGVLSMAKSSDDTNDSQFFVTEGPQRHLDFNHSVWGQLIEGESIRAAIARNAVNSSSKPINEVVITSATIFDDPSNGLVRLKAVGPNSGSSTITVTVKNSANQTFTRTFTATAAADTANGGPFLSKITVPSIAPGQTVNVQLASTDVEGDAVFYDATKQGSVAYTFNIDHNTGLLTLTAPANYVGPFSISVGVRPATTSTTADTFDTEILNFNSIAAVSAPTGVTLAAASDSGISSTDGITNAATMQFTVAGTIAGATVNLRVGNQIVGSAQATGTTTTITTALVSQLGNGTYSIVATQTSNGQTSGASPALSVTFDNAAPAAIDAAGLPTAANVGRLLSADLSHPEEGKGLRYALDGAPAGLTINATTGLLQWTPVAGQIGPQSVTLRLTDGAGNSQTQQFGISVADAAKVEVLLSLLDPTTSAPLTSASIGQEFILRVSVRDLRTDTVQTGQGVFSAYLDIVYDQAKVELVGSSPITYASAFGNGQTGTATTAGLIDEVGAFSSATVGPGRAVQQLLDVRMRVKAAGQANFSTNPAETAGRGFAIFKEDAKVPDTLVGFGSAALPIAQNFTAVNDTFSANEDSTNNTFAPLDNDTIVSGTNTTLTIQSVGTPDHGGTVSVASDGKHIIYNPATNYNGPESFTYIVRDQSGATATATVTMTVQPVNDPPVANGDTFSSPRTGDVDVFLDVLANDTTGPDTGETLTVTSVSTSSQGGVVKIGTAGNGVLYTPKAGFTGTDTFTYTISDGHGGTAIGNVTVNVQPSVPPPIATSDRFTLNEDATAAEFDVLANDLPSTAGETLTVVDVKAPKGGATVTSNNTRIRYAPSANFNGTEVVTYTLRGSNGGTTTGTVTFTVNPVNDPPTAVSDAAVVYSQPNQSVSVLSNDTNVDTGETLTISAVTQPTTGNGTVTIATDKKSLIYNAPNTDFKGTVTFTYTIDDGTGLTSTANVTLDVRNYQIREVGAVNVGVLKGVKPIVRQISGPSIGTTAFNVITTEAGFKVTNAGPGDYEFTIPALPFISNIEKKIVVSSAVADTSSLSTTVDVGNRSARYIDLRDFRSQTIRRGITTAVGPNSNAYWYDGQGDWRLFSNIKVSMNAAGDSITITATNPSNQNVTATLPVSDRRVSLRARDGNNSLLRIQAAPSEIGFTVVASSSSSISTNALSTNTSDSSGSAGSGEGEMISHASQSFMAPTTTPSSNPISVSQPTMGQMTSTTNPSHAMGEGEGVATPLISTGTATTTNKVGAPASTVLDPKLVDKAIPQVVASQAPISAKNLSTTTATKTAAVPAGTSPFASLKALRGK